MALLAIGFVTLGVNNLVSTNHRLRVKELQLKSVRNQLDEVQVTKDNLKTELKKEIEQKNVNQEKVKELEKKNLENEQKQRELEAQLQAKAKSRTLPGTAVAHAATLVSGNKQTWLVASGIPESDWWAVDYIVTKESGWNPSALNPTSGACGLVQQYPCGKIAGDWTDPVAALKWQYNYVTVRYGGYAQAVDYWNVYHSY